MGRKPKKISEKKIFKKKPKELEEKVIIEEKPDIKVKTVRTLRGMRDILPIDQKYWDLVRETADKVARGYGFKRIDLPILEETGLFVRSIGKQTDIVEKEMFSFVDQGGENISLRPEFTAGVARAYIQHGMVSWPQPVKLYYIGPVFRHERPQAGRLRQHNQFGCETLGSENPAADAQLILVASNFFKEIGIEVDIHINSIGCPECRGNYKAELTNYYRSKRSSLCEDCKRRLAKNPMRLLDCKEEGCQGVREEAPQTVDWLCEPCKNHFVKVLEYLDELNVSYNLNSHLVRGLDYYTRTVFEIWPTVNAVNKAVSLSDVPKPDSAVDPEEASIDDRRQSALGGGGRYDGLIGNFGGAQVPACGWGIGLERTILKIKEQQIVVPEKEKVDVFLAQLGEQAKRKAFPMFENLKKEGFKVAENFAKDSLKSQLEMANRLGVRFALILGQKETVEGTLIIRDMESGNQELIDSNKLMPILKKKLSEPVANIVENNIDTGKKANNRKEGELT